MNVKKHSDYYKTGENLRYASLQTFIRLFVIIINPEFMPVSSALKKNQLLNKSACRWSSTYLQLQCPKMASGANFS